MAEEFRIVITDESGGGAGAGGASLGGAASVAASSAGVLGAKLGGGLAIGMEIVSILSDAVSGILKPIRGILVNLGKMIAEFLRPISDMVQIALMPVLMIVRPLLSMFKAFMAPAMTAAREFANLSNMYSAQGDTAGAVKSAAAGVGALLGPFVVSISTIFLQLASTAMTTIFGEIMKLGVDMFAGIASIIFPTFKGKIGEFADGMKSDIDARTLTIQNDISTALTSAATVALDAMGAATETKLAEFQTAYKLKYENALMIPTKEVLASMNTETSSSMNSVSTKYGMGLSMMQTATSDFVLACEANAKKLKDAMSDSGGIGRVQGPADMRGLTTSNALKVTGRMALGFKPRIGGNITLNP